MKNKKGASNYMVTLILLAMVILIGIAFATNVANVKSTQTKLQTVSNESNNLQTLGCYTAGGQVNESNSACNITASNWYSAGDWRLSKSQCYLTSVSVTNATGTELTLNTDYKIDSDSGIIQLLNTATTANSSATMSNNLIDIDYSYCGSGYLTSSGDRGLANLWTLMMIMVLLAIAVGVVSKVFKSK